MLILQILSMIYIYSLRQRLIFVLILYTKTNVFYLFAVCLLYTVGPSRCFGIELQLQTADVYFRNNSD